MEFEKKMKTIIQKFEKERGSKAEIDYKGTTYRFFYKGDKKENIKNYTKKQKAIIKQFIYASLLLKEKFSRQEIAEFLNLPVINFGGSMSGKIIKNPRGTGLALIK